MQNNILLDNQSDYEFLPNFSQNLENFLKEMAQNLNISLKKCELIILDNKAMQEINKTYRNIDKPTDVLSFPLECEFSLLFGSIIISIDYAKEVSNMLHHSLEEEIYLLFIHGFLHLVGYDHEKDQGEQRAKEEEFIKLFNLPSSLITRNS
ncbi:rRNA maturation RNase YbeY [Helicobacter valdiviensis]|uniref:Endoribonuclease YbeY n=1 Tax=Helicobacter valdiviensis TaxID=1458358 RepID=A0A2W6PQV5_9HELI|nr:rRNA maturation RNase YbeY [Helicobacter valdiviensis]PZT49133.1 rRNA maturation RNase YbeY [Helicobacter valdiviensis]